MPDESGDMYLDLIEKVLLGVIYEDPPMDYWSGGQFRSELRNEGLDWPSKAHTMIGFKRLRNIRQLAEKALNDNVPGDFIETGAWRGGACIYMRAILKAHQCTDRQVWVADSFAGLPEPDQEKYPHDRGDKHHTISELTVSLEQVRENFSRYGLLDDQVHFLKGWFKDTLPAAPIKKLAMLRLDGDMYGSTMEALTALYDKVSRGGFIIVDDYNSVVGCKQAITDFRVQKSISDPLHAIDRLSVFWRKTRETLNYS